MSYKIKNTETGEWLDNLGEWTTDEGQAEIFGDFDVADAVAKEFQIPSIVPDPPSPPPAPEPPKTQRPDDR